MHHYASMNKQLSSSGVTSRKILCAASLGKKRQGQDLQQMMYNIFKIEI